MRRYNTFIPESYFFMKMLALTSMFDYFMRWPFLIVFVEYRDESKQIYPTFLVVRNLLK
jgi:hypothetical protein